MELQTEEGTASDEFLREFMRSRIWNGGGMAVRSDPQSRSGAVTVYLARRDAQLPEVPIN
jgi:hypothetical protein